MATGAQEASWILIDRAWSTLQDRLPSMMLINPLARFMPLAAQPPDPVSAPRYILIRVGPAQRWSSYQSRMLPALSSLFAPVSEHRHPHKGPGIHLGPLFADGPDYHRIHLGNRAEGLSGTFSGSRYGRRAGHHSQPAVIFAACLGLSRKANSFGTSGPPKIRPAGGSR